MPFYRDASNNYLGQFNGASLPAGAVEVPSAPATSQDTWNGSAWVTPAAAKREGVSISRADFLKACVAQGIITAEVAEEAATGLWPTAFNAFLGGLTADQRIEAKATWTDGGDVRRDNEILALIQANLGVSDATVDLMFGIS